MGRFGEHTILDPVSPFVEQPEPHVRNIVTLPFQSRIQPHIIYTLYISRDFGFAPFCQFLQKPAFLVHFEPFFSTKEKCIFGIL